MLHWLLLAKKFITELLMHLVMNKLYNQNWTNEDVGEKRLKQVLTFVSGPGLVIMGFCSHFGHGDYSTCSL